MTSPSPIALCIHGHFYQPPRENPWTDRVPREPSAAPFHDWNARIHSECYRANAFARINDGAGRIEAIVDNYDRISFNFGPTLARWLGRHDPSAEARLREADVAQRKRLGSGGAIAQAYAHPIVPLSNARDARTQLVWGLHDFNRRFGHGADGLWLPETAVSPETLETLIELGVRYTILAPEQITAVRMRGTEEWTAVDRDTLDTGRGYFWRHRDGSGRTIALAIFDGPLSRAVAFGETANRAESLLDAVSVSAERSKVAGQRLVLCASDGELWGHHKKFADLTLAFATRVEAQRRGIEVTNLGAYLARHPPAWEVQLAEGPDGEGTAWSCSHGLGRWKRDCGCNMGGPEAGNQAWRGPLRRAL
ncbi:MAG TPA: glycoside hydrolase, partial [Polyangia bacterium]|nr:glycoside hydrolase [Polyangia bacterium]